MGVGRIKCALPDPPLNPASDPAEIWERRSGGRGGRGDVCWVITKGSQIRAGFKDVVDREVGEAGEGRTFVEDRS